MADPHSSAEALLALAEMLITEQPLEITLTQVCELATSPGNGADWAAVTLLEREGPTTAAATSHEARAVDAAQYANQSGPCLDAYRHQEVLRIESTASDRRWPAFSQAAFEAGVRSTLSLPLIVSGDGLGALNLYSFSVHGFSEDDETSGVLFARHASMAVGNARTFWRTQALADQLKEALTTRGVIEQAKGILISQTGGSDDEVFQTLVGASQRTHRKLHQVAAEIVQSARQRSAPA